MIRKLIKNKDGAALVTLIIVLVVVVILTMSISILFSSNLKQIKQQEHHTQTHYLALSGIEMAYNALMTEDIDGTKLYEKFKWDKVTYPDINDDLTAKNNSGDFPLVDTIIVEGSNVVINITPINTNGKREIRIHSFATLSGSGNTGSLFLTFNSENIRERRWE
ncbi:MAG TPA: hypothetical protein DCG34_10125 [Clostridiales bacterium]|nr:hypothetical protein [Clostridiales bacterium]